MRVFIIKGFLGKKKKEKSLTVAHYTKRACPNKKFSKRFFYKKKKGAYIAFSLTIFFFFKNLILKFQI